MTESEITKKIAEKNKEYREVAKKLNSIRTEINNLYEKREEVTMQTFFDYAEIGTTIEIGKRIWIDGHANGEYLKNLKKEKNVLPGQYYDGYMSLALSVGDIIEIIKINKKSINIKIIKKHTTRLVSNSTKTGSVKQSVIEYPNWTIRVDRIKLCRSLMKDEDFKKRVETTSKRKSILDEILS